MRLSFKPNVMCRPTRNLWFVNSVVKIRSWSGPPGGEGAPMVQPAQWLIRHCFHVSCSDICIKSYLHIIQLVWLTTQYQLHTYAILTLKHENVNNRVHSCTYSVAEQKGKCPCDILKNISMLPGGIMAHIYEYNRIHLWVNYWLADNLSFATGTWGKMTNGARWWMLCSGWSCCF